jgi:hypothetical protein
MVRINTPLKAAAMLCVFTAAFSSTSVLGSTSAFANSRTSAEQAKMDAARELVARYRELRRSCTDRVGEERKLCFQQLHAHNHQYQTAKRQLELGKTDPENIHLVTF